MAAKLRSIGGVQFMTWENVGGFNDDGSHKPKYWWVWRVDKADEDRSAFTGVVPEHEVFEDIVKPDDFEGDDYVRATRLPGDLVDEASELFKEVIAFDE